jgi:amino acid transporter
MQFSIAIAAVIAMTSVLLVFQMGPTAHLDEHESRWIIASHFSENSSKYKTPSFATLVTGLVVGVPILFTDKTFVLDFTSIATLFAFVLVCGGVLLIPPRKKEPGRFHIPYINARFIFPLIVIGAILTAQLLSKNYFADLFNFDFSNNEDYVNNKISFMDAATPNISLIIFLAKRYHSVCFCVYKKIFSHTLMGLITCLYLLTGMTKSNWAWFLSWLLLGVIFYFLYGYKKSKLALAAAAIREVKQEDTPVP